VFEQFRDGGLVLVTHLVPTADFQQRSPAALAERAVMIYSANIDARVSDLIALAHARLSRSYRQTAIRVGHRPREVDGDSTAQAADRRRRPGQPALSDWDLDFSS
jgi:hypothetical protein